MLNLFMTNMPFDILIIQAFLFVVSCCQRFLIFPLSFSGGNLANVELKSSEAIPIEETIKIVFKPLFFGAVITSCVFFFLMFSKSPTLKNIGLFGGLFVIGGLVGLLLVLPVIIQDKIKFRGKPLSFNLDLFSIKNKTSKIKLAPYIKKASFYGAF